jgi:hypothetical protein
MKEKANWLRCTNEAELGSEKSGRGPRVGDIF